jgi:hypothetical protein
MVPSRACWRPSQHHLSRHPIGETGLWLEPRPRRPRCQGLRKLLHQPPLYPTRSDGPSDRMPKWAVEVTPLVLRSRWCNPNHPVPNRLTQHIPPTESVTAREDHRSPGAPPYRGLHRVNAPSSLHGLFPNNRGCSPASCPQNREPI